MYYVIINKETYHKFLRLFPMLLTDISGYLNHLFVVPCFSRTGFKEAYCTILVWVMSCILKLMNVLYNWFCNILICAKEVIELTLLLCMDIGRADSDIFWESVNSRYISIKMRSMAITIVSHLTDFYIGRYIMPRTIVRHNETLINFIG